MSFGGAVKLTGESEYRKALQNIKLGLKEVAAQMKLTSASYDKNDKSVAALTARIKDQTAKMDLQKQKVEQIKKQYNSLNQQYEKQTQKHNALLKEYDNEKKKLETIGRELGTTSKEYEAQKQVVEQYEADIQKSAKAQDANAATLSKLRVEVKNAEADYKTSEKALNDYNAELEASKKAASETKSAYDKLKDDISKQEDELEKLKKKYADVVIEQGKNSEEAQELAGKYRNLSGELKTNKEKLDDVERGLDDVGKAAEDSGKKADSAAKDGFTTFKGTVANLASDAISKALDGLKKLGGALVDVGKQALGSYADYEQLVGGVETLFKDSAPIVKKNAENAYKTAGMSANQYMETVTGFSATLLQGLEGDTKKAAQVADVAISDMSDNANKMGTSMESIQNAYQGFAKQNYTMLDNLKLGYGGTASEMARLVNESGVMNDGFNATAENVKQIPFDKLIEAIHKTQENMGITGTTAKEASSTIEGSTNSMKAAWDNLLRSVADDNADMGKSMDVFVDSAITAGKNVIPRVKLIFENIKKMVGKIVTEVFPKLKREVPQLKPLIEVFEWFVKNRGKVVTAVKLMIAAFAIKKIWNFTKQMSDAAKGVIDYVRKTTLMIAAKKAETAAETRSTAAKAANAAADTAGAAAATASAAASGADAAAKGVETTTTNTATVAQIALNTAMKSNPIGFVVGALTTLISVLGMFIDITGGASKEEEEYKEKLDATTQAYDDKQQKITDTIESYEKLAKASQDDVSIKMTEIGKAQDLWKELQTIVEKNGAIKKGYEERADFITSQLSEALGIEFEKNGQIISNYQQIQEEMDKVIEKKKAQIILDSQEDLYSEALKNQREATEELETAESEYATERRKLYDMNNQLLTLQKEQEDAYNAWHADTMDGRLRAEYEEKKAAADAVYERVKDQRELVDKTEENYKKMGDIVDAYAYNISLYEDNLKKFHDGNYKEMSQVTWEYVRDYQDAGDAQKKMLEDQIQNEDSYLSRIESLRDKSGTKLFDEQIKTIRKTIAEKKDELKKYTSVTEQGLKQTEVAWSKSLAEQLSKVTGKKVEFKDAGKGKVQAYIDGIKTGEPIAQKEAAALVDKSIKEISSKTPEAQKAGEDLIKGVNKGIKDQDLQGGVFKEITNFGTKLLGRLRTALQEKSPSKATKQMGEYLMEGLTIGVEAESKKALKTVQKTGATVLGALNAELSAGTKIGNIDIAAATIKPDLTAATRRANSEARQQENGFDRMVSAFKTALSQMKIELDDEVAGEFVEKTVTKVIYA